MPYIHGGYTNSLLRFVTKLSKVRLFFAQAGLSPVVAIVIPRQPKPTTPLLFISDRRRVRHSNATGFVEIGR